MDRLDRLSRSRRQQLSLKTDMRGPVHYAFITLPSGAPIARGRGDTQEEAIEEAFKEAGG